MAQPEQLPNDFPELLRHYRERIPLSRNKLAELAGVDTSYIARLEYGEREPPRRHIVDVLISPLFLLPHEGNKLIVAAGYAPEDLKKVGWDDTLEAVLSVLSNPNLTEEDKNRFRELMITISIRWNKSP